MQLKEGSELQNGKYRIIRVLGQGGFGITYLAENIYFEKMVAIKEFFPKDFCGRDNTSHLTLGTQNNAETVEKLKARFLKEARNIAKLDHPGIIKIHDIFEENNTAYYVMDYIEGENLNQMVKRDGSMSEEKAVGYITTVGEALEYIHSRQMTHFDVKPANIMVRRADNMPILIDFGLSKQYDAQGDATSTLMQGVSHGYSPIELYNAGAITSFSPQTDVYSLAATLYYLISNTIPPHATVLIEENITFPIGFPMNLQKALSKAMSSARKNRYESVSIFVSEIKTMEKSEDTQIIQPTPTHGNNTPKIEAKANIRLNQKIETLNLHNDGYETKVSKDTNIKKTKSYSIILGITIIVVLLFISFFNIESTQDTEISTNLVPTKENIISLEEQMNMSSPVIVEAPNYNTSNYYSSIPIPQIKKVNQKKLIESELIYSDEYIKEWISRNAIETYLPLFNASPCRDDYSDILESLCDLPVPLVINGQKLRFWKQDDQYNYFAYETESYSEPKPIRLFITNKENNKVLFDYKFDNYIYPPQFIESNKNLINFEISNFTLQNKILYFSFYHRTYAVCSHGMNGYISALETESNKIKWLSKSLVCNANFIIDGDYIITGYGFTDEPDFLYILDKYNGSIISQTPLANGPEIIGINKNHIFVRTYSYEYDFIIKK